MQVLFLPQNMHHTLALLMYTMTLRNFYEEYRKKDG